MRAHRWIHARRVGRVSHVVVRPADWLPEGYVVVCGGQHVLRMTDAPTDAPTLPPCRECLARFAEPIPARAGR